MRFLLIVLFCAHCRTSAAQDVSPACNILQSRLQDISPALREQIQQAHEHIQANPGSADASGRLGMILQALEQHDLAAPCYQRAQKLEPREFRWSYYLAVAETALGHDAAALANFRGTVQLEPGYFPARLKLAQLLLAGGEIDESRKNWELLAKQYPGSAPPYYGLGQVRSAMGDVRGAIDSYTRACELSFDFAAAHYALGLAYRKLGDVAKAQEHMLLYEQQRGNGPSLEDPLMDAVNSLKTGGYHHFQKGWVLETSGHIHQAMVEYERALELDPSIVQAHINLTSLYATRNQFEKAEEHFRESIRINPNLAESHYNHGVMLAVQDKLQEAEQAFRTALRINPLYADAYNNLGTVLERTGRTSEAISQYRQAVENKPNHRLAHFSLARLLRQNGRYDEAIEHLLKTVGVADEKTPIFMFTLADTYAKSGDFNNAVQYARQAKEMAASRGQTELARQIETALQQFQKASVSP